MQRVSSMALLPLTIWFVVSLATSAGMTQPEAAAWIGHPLNAVLLLAFIGSPSSTPPPACR
jgi:succinate dehydrogenase / fumarate reductase membrane anchor subunit